MAAGEPHHLDIGDRVRVEDDARRVIAIENDGVRAGAAIELVAGIERGAHAEDVVAAAAIDRVVAALPEQEIVVPRRACESVVPAVPRMTETVMPAPKPKPGPPCPIRGA